MLTSRKDEAFSFIVFFWNNWEKHVSSYMKIIHKSFPFIQLKLIRPCRLQVLSGHLFLVYLQIQYDLV
jgi:hypothetical protein